MYTKSENLNLHIMIIVQCMLIVCSMMICLMFYGDNPDIGFYTVANKTYLI